MRRVFYIAETLLLVLGTTNCVAGLFRCMTIYVSLCAQQSVISRLAVLLSDPSSLKLISFSWVCGVFALVHALPLAAARISAFAFFSTLMIPLTYDLYYPSVAFVGGRGLALLMRVRFHHDAMRALDVGRAELSEELEFNLLRRKQLVVLREAEAR